MPASGTLVPNSCEGGLEFRDVSFSYPTRPGSLILDRFSLKIKPGEVLALVGPSGGGKSSIISMLERLYDPVSGSVLLDNRPLPSLSGDFLHSQLAIVSQEPTLFARTIRENIIYGLDPLTVSQAQIEDAAREANALDFINSLPEGFYTQCGEKVCVYVCMYVCKYVVCMYA